MKRRDFIPKAGLAALAAPFAALSMLRGSSEASPLGEAVPPDPYFCPEKFLLDSPESVKRIVRELRDKKPKYSVMGVAIVPRDAHGNCLKYKFHRHDHSWGDGFCNWDQLADKMRKYQIEMCAVPLFPDSLEALRFKGQFPGHVVTITYGDTESCRATDMIPFARGLWRHRGTNTSLVADRDFWYHNSHPAASRDIALEVLRVKKGSALGL